MRLSISCAHCRQSKVKCIHDGHPPCRRCHRLNREPCVLTDPRATASRTSKTPRRKKTTLSSEGRQTSTTASPSNGLREGEAPSPSLSPVTGISAATLIAACDMYRRKFPILNFLHYPSLITDLSSDASAVEPIFLAAMLSLCARFMADPALDPPETYAEFARSQLARRAFEAPSLSMAQSLVMISMYEWGSGRPYPAWMYSGMATYMIQSLLKTADDHMEHSPDDLDVHFQITYEQLVRTYWCCFAQDCELSSGARQHFALSFRQISVPLPISDSDFTFGKSCQRLTPADLNHTSPQAIRLCIDRGLTIVTRGFDVFVRILRFANESRRERARGALYPSLQTWNTLKVELDEWRAFQDTTVRYPETGAPAHVAMGYGELFAYINLVYFMSTLFLYRDRLLSVPKVNDVPDGAEGDMDEAIDHLFATAQHIGAIISALESCSTPVITPYAGFSVFVAAHINMYGTVCPARYPGGLERAELEKKKNFEYLERLCRYWDVGNSWWRTLQEANRFYETARSTQQSQTPDHLTLAGTLDEYGDIRVSRPDTSSSTRRSTPTTVHEGGTGMGRTSIPVELSEHGEIHDFEAEMLQWPFIDETWSAGFDKGFDAAWPGLG